MPYPAFYQAWHQDTFDTSATQSLDLADLPRILTEEIAKDLELQEKVRLICIDGNKFIDQDNPAIEIYDQILDQDFPERNNGEPDTIAKLKSYWNSLRRKSNQIFVLLFYENPSRRKPQGFSEVFLDALITFEGLICLITEQSLDDIPIQCFTPDQTAKDVVTWISQN